ncbi:unnamed protein product [Acidithrix sp. C25]|nr:unnamed protein product [Acidithrix sp. C25]
MWVQGPNGIDTDKSSNCENRSGYGIDEFGYELFFGVDLCDVFESLL